MLPIRQPEEPGAHQRRALEFEWISSLCLSSTPCFTLSLWCVEVPQIHDRQLQIHRLMDSLHELSIHEPKRGAENFMTPQHF